MGKLFRLPGSPPPPPPSSDDGGDDDSNRNLEATLDRSELIFALGMFGMFVAIILAALASDHSRKAEERKCMTVCMVTIPNVTTAGCKTVCGLD